MGADEIRIDSGLLSRTSRAIPFDRVTDVDLEQGPLHRLFGLARVRLETGASAGSKEEDGVLDTISLERAEALREHIRARRRGEQAAPAAEAIAEGEPLYAMDSRRVATAGLFNFSLAVIAGLFGVTQTFGDVLGFDPFERSFWLDLLDRAEPLRALVLAHQIVAILGGTILLILLGIGTGLVRTTLARTWLSPRPHRSRPSPPPRPAYPDRRHHSGQARPGRDPRQRPDPRSASAGGC